VRRATAVDIDALERIETAADHIVKDLLGVDDWGAVTSGAARASMPGFILVATDDASDTAVGFAHVVERPDSTHLDQLSVLPSHARRGLGRALVSAAMSEAAERGGRRMTLVTYADVPWNAPFYRSCGFVEDSTDSALVSSLLLSESEAELARYGRRVLMVAELST
jgi:GNAT superfamily N-acetyltransferase